MFIPSNRVVKSYGGNTTFSYIAIPILWNTLQRGELILLPRYDKLFSSKDHLRPSKRARGHFRSESYAIYYHTKEN